MAARGGLRVQAALAAGAVLIAAGCSIPGSAPSPAPATSASVAPVQSATPTPSPSPSSFGQRTLEPGGNRYEPPAKTVCPTPTTRVGTSGQLRAAVRGAGPGTVIEVAAGTYRTGLTITADGTAQAPIFLCGAGRVIIDGGGPAAAPVVDFRRARYWRLLDLTVRNGSVGVRGEHTGHVVLQSLVITDTGRQGVWWRRGSSDNVVRESSITDTGRSDRAAGQGLAAGRASAIWCLPERCDPDESNRNVIMSSEFRRTTGSAVLAYEGTYNGVVDGNVIDGRSLVGESPWVDIHGVSWTVTDNRGRHAPRDGYRSFEVFDGSGSGNRFADNSGTDLNERRDDGYLVALRPDRTARLECSNTVSDRSAPVSNRRCRR